MVFEPEELANGAAPIVAQDGGVDSWQPLFRHSCSFPPSIFDDVMINLIKNPNINSSWLFRADIISDDDGSSQGAGAVWPLPSFSDFQLRRRMVRTLIPRNALRDKPLDQSCLIYDRSSPADEDCHDDDGIKKTLVVYFPHVISKAEMPFYHPEVRGIAFLYEWAVADSTGSVSISYSFFDEGDRSVVKLARTAYQLLKVIIKHGEGRASGYQKRVQHDVLVPQARVQNTYATLKQKYARRLIETWAEVTDPEKHVFEDLSIAAFLIELWADMYSQSSFPGFVDIGCGNGLLVYILTQEGFSGWGFDARRRKSWARYTTMQSQSSISTSEKCTLEQLVLLPPPVSKARLPDIAGDDFSEDIVHDGRFPEGTFIISNHADELTPWTPVLATISNCPFMMIPCCSHDFTGSKFRAPPPKDKTKAESSYGSLVQWVAEIARDCGWEVEQEMLRIPSTRNTALIGRRRTADDTLSTPDIEAIVHRYGGTAGYLENVVKLAKTSTSSASLSAGR